TAVNAIQLAQAGSSANASSSASGSNSSSSTASALNSSNSSSSASPPHHPSNPSKHTRVYLNMHDGMIRCAAFPEIEIGILVTGGIDSTIQLWKKDLHIEHSEYVLWNTLYGHRASILCLAVSKSFNIIASG